MSKSVYEMVTDRIINQLEQGVIPWQKPWTGVLLFVTLPTPNYR